MRRPRRSGVPVAAGLALGPLRLALLCLAVCPAGFLLGGCSGKGVTACQGSGDCQPGETCVGGQCTAGPPTDARPVDGQVRPTEAGAPRDAGPARDGGGAPDRGAAHDSQPRADGGPPPPPSGSIFNTFVVPDTLRQPRQTYEESRTIAGHQGQPTTLAFRLALYGDATANMPLLVQVHEWGGNFDREEELASYVPVEYSFVMLYFQYQPSSGNEDDWWFGTRWDGVCHMWAHEAVMAMVGEAIGSSLVPDHLPGASIDRNRVFLFGHSIGGTGAWQLGVRHPEVFAAVHAHAGFARFTPPVGDFQELFEEMIVGGPGDRVTIPGDDGRSYPARDYSNLAWWLESHRDPSSPTPFVTITGGTADEATPIASGGDLMAPVFDRQKRGYYYYRHTGQHSDECLIGMNWMWNFRLDQSFLAFTNRSGYGIGLDQAVPAGAWSGYISGGVNNLYELGWDPSSIVDREDRYEVQLVGTGNADVTPRRLQRFRVSPGAAYRYWLDSESGPGTGVRADSHGLLTVPQVSGGRRIILRPGAG